MIEFEKPNIECLEVDDANNYAKFVCEPLERGYGVTIGNSLRRILLSSLPGCSITSVKIDGVLHEFSAIDNVVEDVPELIVNLKNIRLKFDGEKGRLMIPVIALLLGGAGMLAGKVCGSLGVNPTEIFQKLDALSEGQLLGGGILFGVICLAISYVCSLRVLEKKEY